MVDDLEALNNNLAGAVVSQMNAGANETLNAKTQKNLGDLSIARGDASLEAQKFHNEDANRAENLKLLSQVEQLSVNAVHGNV